MKRHKSWLYQPEVDRDVLVKPYFEDSYEGLLHEVGLDKEPDYSEIARLTLHDTDSERRILYR